MGMTLTANVESGVVSRVTITGGTLGLPVVGENLQDGTRWEVVSEFPGHAVVDPLAPLNAPVAYRCGDEMSAPVVRESRVFNAFTSLDGSIVVPFIMPHEWSEPIDTDLSMVKAGGQVWVTYGRDVSPGAHPVQARVEGKSIVEMRALIKQQQPFVFLHNRCPLPDCPVPPVFICVTGAAAGSVSPRKDLGEMFFDLELQPYDHRGAPVSARSWWDTLNDYGSWFGVDLIEEAFK